jgi:hypothetical protein
MASEKEEAATLPYCKIIRILIFAATVTPPDVPY